MPLVSKVALVLFAASLVSCAIHSSDSNDDPGTSFKALDCESYLFMYNPDLAAVDETSEILKIVSRVSSASGFAIVEVTYLESSGRLMIVADSDPATSSQREASMETLAEIDSLEATCNDPTSAN